MVVVQVRNVVNFHKISWGLNMHYIEAISNYNPQNAQEANDQKILLSYIRAFQSNVLTRENEIAHITSSALILNKALDQTLMIHHNIYQTWAWTGGHADGEEDLFKVAVKEALEETGLETIEALSSEIASIDIIPVYGHIKRGKYVSSHLHLNISYVLIADKEAKLKVNLEETSGVRWISIDEIEQYSNEPYLVEIYLKLINDAKKRRIF